jgi:hypothetical protein
MFGVAAVVRVLEKGLKTKDRDTNIWQSWAKFDYSQASPMTLQGGNADWTQSARMADEFWKT